MKVVQQARKWILTALGLSLLQTAPAQVAANRNVTIMGSRWGITIVAADSITAEKYIDTVIAEANRIDFLLSDWKAETQVSAVNRNAGIAPVKVDKELLDITQRAIYFSTLTNGAFDISFAAMEKIWRFDGSMTELPTPETVKKAVEKVGYQNIEIDTVQSTIFLKHAGMKIGFGALGEGYAADKCRDLMKQKGIVAGIVDGSGDIGTWGHRPNGKPWTIGITNPFDPIRVFAVVPLQQGSVTTSGSYEKYAEINGVRYSHIINPATGYPVTELMSVTVFGPSTETCNALSTSLMVLGKTAGLQLLKQFKAYSCVMVSSKGKYISSPGFKLKRYKFKN